MNNKKSFIKKIGDSRLFWFIASLMIALWAWLYVTGLETEEFKQTFRGVRVEFAGEDLLSESKGLVITDLDTNTVTVTVTGPRRIVSAMNSYDIVAQIDVSKLNQSAYTSLQYQIVFPDGIDTSLLEITAKTPDTINFLVSKQNSKTIQVRGSFDGDTADGYTAETPVFEPSTITISGPEAYIKDVSYAWVSFGAEEIASTYSVETGFVLKNSSGEDCPTEHITLSDTVIVATLPILEVKNVPLTVDLVDGSGATAENTVVTIEPGFVTLAGDSAILDGLNKIVLKTIDLTDFSTSYSDVFPISINNELRNLTGITEAVVNVEIIGLETRTFRISNLSCTNVTEGYTSEIQTEYIDVVLRGTPEQLELVTSENIRAVADLSDYNESTGQYMASVKVYIDNAADVGPIGDYSISVILRKA